MASVQHFRSTCGHTVRAAPVLKTARREGVIRSRREQEPALLFWQITVKGPQFTAASGVKTRSSRGSGTYAGTSGVLEALAAAARFLAIAPSLFSATTAEDFEGDGGESLVAAAASPTCTAKRPAAGSTAPSNTAELETASMQHFRSACGHTVRAAPVLKTGGEMEGMWWIHVKGPQVTGVKFKTFYSHPSTAVALMTAAEFLAIAPSSFSATTAEDFAGDGGFGQKYTAAAAAAAAAAASPTCAAKGPAAGSAVPRTATSASVAPAAAARAPAHAAPAVAAVSTAAAAVAVGYSSDDDVQVVGEVTTADREAAARAAAVELTSSCGTLLVVERQAAALHFGFSTDERCVVIVAMGGRVIQKPLRCH
jgi:hypothetical protein